MNDTEIARRIWTIGHSTHPFERLVELLHMHAIEALADVRKVPRSRRMPWFAGDSLTNSLPEHGIGYHHFRELGGFRKPRPDTPNGGWEHPSFRGYADHLASDEFARGIERLQALATARNTAVMCAEAQWHRCHRRLVSDALVARGWEVLHIASDGRVSAHELTSFAVRHGERLTYPPAQETLGFA